MGAAPRRRLGSSEQRQVEGLRQLRALLRDRPAGHPDPGPRQRIHHVRPQPEPEQGRPDQLHELPLRVRAGRRARPAEPQGDVSGRDHRRRRVRVRQGLVVRRQGDLQGPRARGRGPLRPRGEPGHRAVLHVARHDLRAHQPGPGRRPRHHQGPHGQDLLSERGRRRQRQPRGRSAVRFHAAAPVLPGPRVHGDAPVLEQLLPQRELPLLEARRQLLGQPLADA